MTVFHRNEKRGELPAALRGGVIAIGNFDGVHRGHQTVLGRALEIAADQHIPSLVLTFEPHPRSVFRPDQPVFRLTPAPLKARLRNKGRTLSGGEQQMLTMARSLGTEPRLVLIDEPTEGLMPAFVETIGETIVEIQRQGLAVLLVEQNTRLALAATRRVYLIEKGLIRHEGRSSDLQADAEVRLRYLGV